MAWWPSALADPGIRPLIENSAFSPGQVHNQLNLVLLFRLRGGCVETGGGVALRW